MPARFTCKRSVLSASDKSEMPAPENWRYQLRIALQDRDFRAPAAPVYRIAEPASTKVFLRIIVACEIHKRVEKRKKWTNQLQYRRATTRTQ
jgi:hypothetical protein